MSLFSEILLLPFTPVRGVAWLGATIAEHAEEVLAEQQDPRRGLDELAEAREHGELTDDEYAAAEEALLRELVPEPVYLEPEEPDR